VIAPSGFGEAVAASGAGGKAVPDMPLASFGEAERVRKLPLARLRPSPFNVRRFRTEARVREVGESLMADGQQEPIRVYPGQDGDAGFYMIVSGVTRYQAALALGWETLDARVDTALDPADIVALVRISHLHNDSARETDLDHAVIARELAGRGVPAAEIAAALGYSSSRKVFRLKTFHELPTAVFDVAAQYPHRISAVIAEALRNAAERVGEETALALARECVAENLSRDGLNRRVGAEIRKRERSGAGAREEINRTVSYGRRKIGRFRVQNLPNASGKRVHFSASLPADVADEFSRNMDALIRALQEKSAASG
jgi:ParB/RepB/Spo0J family partition protein